jgi:hypothetical protein
VLASLGAPLSCLAGERAGALVLHEHATAWVPLVALTWSSAMAALLYLQHRSTSPVDGASNRLRFE